MLETLFIISGFMFLGSFTIFIVWFVGAMLLELLIMVQHTYKKWSWGQITFVFLALTFMIGAFGMLITNPANFQ